MVSLDKNGVLMSIQPQWCQLIASGQKTIEVRKTRPKLETPFKVYIYCTLPPKSEFFWHHNEEGRRTIGEYAHELLKLPNGKIVYDYGMRLACEEGEYTKDNFLCRKVIGEFTCDKIAISLVGYDDIGHAGYHDLLEGSCLSNEELMNYGKWGSLYGWHISDLVIYDTPKELSEFKQCHKCEYRANCFEHEYSCDSVYNLTRPPQSWCYVKAF